MSPVFIPLIVVGGIVAFVIHWVAISHLLAWISGWKRMARHYVAPADFREEPVFALTYASVGGVRYRGAIHIGVGPSGLYLACVRLFSAGAPPLLIPWEHVHDDGERFTMNRLRITGMSRDVKLAVAKRVWAARVSDAQSAEAGPEPPELPGARP